MMWSSRTPALFFSHSLNDAHRNVDQDDIFNYTPVKNKLKKGKEEIPEG